MSFRPQGEIPVNVEKKRFLPAVEMTNKTNY